jgi:O-acetyl-ADP-ribose deacetylase (regulator of RNase III)
MRKRASSIESIAQIIRVFLSVFVRIDVKCKCTSLGWSFKSYLRIYRHNYGLVLPLTLEMSTRKAARRGRAPVPDVHKPSEAYVPGTMEHTTQFREGTLINCVQADILTFKADAIVNAANTTLRGGGGVDGAIHAAAGPEMLAELRREFPAGGVVGGAYRTKAYNIRTAKHVIHAIGPDFRLEPDELDDPRLKTAGTLLKEAYTRSLRIAVLLGARTVAFPTISTDIYAFPRYVAAINAMIAVRNFVDGEGAGKFDRISFLLWPVGGEDWRPYWSNFRYVNVTCARGDAC